MLPYRYFHGKNNSHYTLDPRPWRHSLGPTPTSKAQETWEQSPHTATTTPTRLLQPPESWPHPHWERWIQGLSPGGSYILGHSPWKHILCPNLTWEEKLIFSNIVSLSIQMTHEESPMPGSRWPEYNKLNCIFRDFCHIMICWDIFFSLHFDQWG